MPKQRAPPKCCWIGSGRAGGGGFHRGNRRVKKRVKTQWLMVVNGCDIVHKAILECLPHQTALIELLPYEGVVVRYSVMETQPG